MRRSISEAAIGAGQVRYRTKIEDDPSPPASLEARNSLLRLFETILTNPDLISCGLNPPQKIQINHSGNNWVLEAEAVADLGA